MPVEIMMPFVDMLQRYGMTYDESESFAANLQMLVDVVEDSGYDRGYESCSEYYN
jgi:hypothetical protein